MVSSQSPASAGSCSRSRDPAAHRREAAQGACLPGLQAWPGSLLSWLCFWLFTPKLLFTGVKIQRWPYWQGIFPHYPFLTHSLAQLLGREKFSCHAYGILRSCVPSNVLIPLTPSCGFSVPALLRHDAWELSQRVNTVPCGDRGKERGQRAAGCQHRTLTMVCPLILLQERLCAVCCWR